MQKKINLRIRSLFVLVVLSLIITGCPPPIPPVLPTVTTTQASSVTASSVTTGGGITEDGGAAVTEKGICWSTSTGPTIANNPIKAGNGLGNFTITISVLNPGVTYYVRAYATNSEGTAYGNEVTFTALANLPTVSTTAASAITAISATSGGNVTADGGGAVMARGVCWSTSANPTTANTKTTDTGTSGIFTSLITGLTAGTIYYLRAYATNSAGTAYGSQVNFTTIFSYSVAVSSNPAPGGTTSGSGVFNSGTLVTVTAVANAGYTFTNWTESGTAVSTTAGYTFAISGNRTLVANYTTGVIDGDGNVYKTVTIGTQVWITEDLKTTKYIDGSIIPLVTDNTIWLNLVTPGFCWHNNDATATRALYNWYAVNTGKLCPSGWHVPSDAEWTILTTYLGGETVAGGKLKETGTSHWRTPNVGATNSSGFTSVPGGNRFINGNFDVYGNYNYWWSSTATSPSSAWYRNVFYNTSSVYRLIQDKYLGFSVRCLRN